MKNVFYVSKVCSDEIFNKIFQFNLDLDEVCDTQSFGVLVNGTAVWTSRVPVNTAIKTLIK